MILINLFQYNYNIKNKKSLAYTRLNYSMKFLYYTDPIFKIGLVNTFLTTFKIVSQKSSGTITVLMAKTSEPYSFSTKIYPNAFGPQCAAIAGSKLSKSIIAALYLSSVLDINSFKLSALYV